MTEVVHTTDDRSPGATGAPQHRAAGSGRPPPAKTPVNSAVLGSLGLLWAAVLIGLGAVAIHDVLVAGEWIGGPAWVEATVDAVARLQADVVLLVVATPVGLLGLVLLWWALRPRRKRGVSVSADSGVFLRHHHLNRLLEARVGTLQGVVSANASARRRKVALRVRGVEGSDPDELRSRVSSQVADDLAVLAEPVKPRIQIVGGSR